MANNGLPVGSNGAPGVSRNVGGANPRARLKEYQVREIRRKFSEGATRLQLVEEYGIPKPTLNAILNRTTWKHVE